MERISIRNLRNLKDTGYIRIAPITCLLGRNSSGKSSFIRSLPLLKQSVDQVPRGPILWFGHQVDFGDFQTSLREGAEEKSIEFGCKLKIRNNDINEHNRYSYIYASPRGTKKQENVDLGYEFSAVYKESSASTIFKTVKLEIFEHTILIEFSSNEEISSIIVNNEDLTEYIPEKSISLSLSGPVPRLVWADQGQMRRFYMYRNDIKDLVSFEREAYRVVAAQSHHQMSSWSIFGIMAGLSLGSSQDMLEDLKRRGKRYKYFSKNVKSWRGNSKAFSTFKNHIIAMNIPHILSAVRSQLRSTFSAVKYTAPVRASAQRYYRIQEISVLELDAMGSNTAMYMKNMAQSERQAFRNWCEENFDFFPKTINKGGHITLEITEKKSGSSRNLADVGFGYSQLLPVILQLWNASSKPRIKRRALNAPIICAFEQPELHLHPKLQAVLANAFVATLNVAKANGIDLRIVMETHSEAIINRLGHEIYEKNINKNDVNIVCFEADGDNCARINEIQFSKEGYIEKWPIGFLSGE